MLIFLYGEDPFRASQKLNEIKQKFLTADPAGSGLSVFDFDLARNASRSDAGGRKIKITDVLGTPNLLSPKRLVIVKNLISSGTDDEQEEILEYFKSNESLAEDKDLVVIFFEGELPKKSKKLFKTLEKTAKSQNFQKMTGTKLDQWVLKRIREIDGKAAISRNALEKLVAYSGGDARVLDSEIGKLINFSPDRMIEEKDVEEMVSANFSLNIFNAIDALGNNDKKSAARLLHEHLKRGEDPFYIFSMFVYQFRNLLKVADLADKGGDGGYAIAKETGLHPFVVKKSLSQIRNFTLDKLKNIYRKLAELDTKIKTGKMDIRLALDKFIVEL